MSSKIKIKIDQVEVEFEGSEEFLSKELPVLLKNVLSLYTGMPSVPPKRDAGHNPPPPPPSATEIKMTTNSVAAKLVVKSGADLLMAAAAHLALVKNMTTFTRQQILNEMKTASSYYKKSYGNNLTGYLNRANSAGTLIENAENAYALSASARASLEKKLA